MGQAKLKKAAGHAPTARSGPHGHDYYCRNRCGRIAFSKTVNQIFVERTVPYWGWCRACTAFLEHQARELEKAKKEHCKHENTILLPRGKQCIDCGHYDGQAMMPLPPVSSTPPSE